MKSKSTHWHYDLKGCNPDKLNDLAFCLNALCEATHVAGQAIREKAAHEFWPQGLSVVLLLAESHASMHTYPENGIALLDFHSCADPDKCEKFERIVLEYFQPKTFKKAVLDRGFE